MCNRLSIGLYRRILYIKHYVIGWFREASLLKPKFLEKESNLLELIHWIKQARNYIIAGYRDAPPKTGIYKYLLPLLHHTWSKALEKYDPDNKALTELLDALEIEAKKGDPKHTRRLKHGRIQDFGLGGPTY